MAPVKRAVSAATALAALAGLTAYAPSAATAQVPGPPRPPAAPVWKSCHSAAFPKLWCASVEVPLDYAHPDGRKITLALSQVPHTAKESLGPLLVNPGGPGGSGLALPGLVAEALPAAVSARYDIIGFDPRGVGKSEPALNCEPGHFTSVRPDPVPHSGAEENANIERAASFAKACGSGKYGKLLEHIDTVDAVKDIDAVRAALRAMRISYFGYSYGTYLGAVYAKLFPQRVRRLVLDSIVDPTGVWYDNNLNQDYAFDARFKAFTAWIAKADSVYHLGSDPGKVEAAWYAVHDELRTRPAGGKVGPGEFEDTFVPGGYYNGYWPDLATALAAYVNKGNEKPLVTLYGNNVTVDGAGDNGYSVYTAVQCRDAKWPRSWQTWHRDTQEVYEKAPFLAWNNTWYNAPCAFWPTGSRSPVDVSNSQLPATLLFQATEDAATPYSGGVIMHSLLKKSSLVVEEGGGNHGITLSGSKCLDGYLSAYLATGKVPRGHGGTADAICQKLPDPVPAAAAVTAKAAAAASGPAPATGDKGLHKLLGTRG
ncbi:MAG: tap 6 [Streptomyces oryziradicis]|nr:tap 6 [Actinacidiphila oryziradicis]